VQSSDRVDSTGLVRRTLSEKRVVELFPRLPMQAAVRPPLIVQEVGIGLWIVLVSFVELQA
jgi:hypothetical protein